MGCVLHAMQIRLGEQSCEVVTQLEVEVAVLSAEQQSDRYLEGAEFSAGDPLVLPVELAE